MTRDVKVAAIQFEPVPGDKAVNLAKVTEMAERAAAEGAEVAIFPECCLTGYWFLRHLSEAQLRELAEPARTGDCSAALIYTMTWLFARNGTGLILLRNKKAADP